MKKILLTLLLAIAITAWLGGVVLLAVNYSRQSDSTSLRGVTIDTVVAGTNTYSTSMASSGVSRLLVQKIGRKSLRIDNIGGGAATVRVNLVSTSTGVTATSGIPIASGGNYVPDFIYEGEVWVITASGTSTIGAQETTP